MMLIRHDKAKVSRLRNFLEWKDVRRTAKDQSDDKGADDIVPDEAPGGGVAGAPAGPLDIKRNKKARVDLVWDVPSFFSEQVPPRDDEEDEEEEESNFATLQRLRIADERTRNMSKDEYVHWSECRQASFTFRKGKRFKEWAGFGIITEAKPNDDIIDILGFLTFEMVQTITEEALKVKAVEDMYKKKTGEGGDIRKRKREPGPFDGPDEAREPVSPAHILEGFRRLQAPSKKSRVIPNGRRSLMNGSLRIVRGILISPAFKAC